MCGQIVESQLWQLNYKIHNTVELKNISQPDILVYFFFSVKDTYQGHWFLMKMHFQWLFFILIDRLDSISEAQFL